MLPVRAAAAFFDLMGTRMFSLHETTKIYLCRAAFVALCIVPTLAVLARSAIVHLPGYTREHERAIAAELGLHAQLAKASSPRPGTMLYESLELSDPETRQPLARLPWVEVRTVGSVVHVKLPFPVMINGTRLDALGRTARDAARQGRSWRDVRLRAQNLTVHLGDGDQSFTDLDGHIETTDEHARFKLNFRRSVVGERSAEPAEIEFVRQGRSTTPSGFFQLTTGPAPLPCSLARSLWPGVECLGTASEFEGRVFVSEQAGRTKTQVSGRLTRVDLDLLVSGRFPHQLSGLADVELAQVAIEDGRIESAGGKITAGPGAVSNSLVQSALVHLRLQGATESKAGPDQLLPYRRLAFAFAINSEGLALHGEAAQTPGAMLVDDHGKILLHEPSVLSQPVVSLARTLVPQSEVQVPATRESAALVRTLPVPSIEGASGGQGPANQARSPRVNPKRK